MPIKQRFVFSVIMAALMAFMMTFLVTAINMGFSQDFLARWGKAFAIGWPIASIAAFFAGPIAQRMTTVVLRVMKN